MMTSENCIACKSKIPAVLSKFFIFQKDIFVQKRLIHKIHQLTGIEFENNDCVICSNCRMILIQIFDLEQRFVNFFKDWSNAISDDEIHTSDAEIGQNILSNTENIFPNPDNSEENDQIPNIMQDENRMPKSNAEEDIGLIHHG